MTTMPASAHDHRPFYAGTTLLALFVLCALSYGVAIPWLGFYWDDWPAVWVLHSLGGAGIREYMSSDRPFLGWLYSITSPVIGESPLPWHVFALVMRWVTAVAAWWTLHGLWPDRRREAATIACLFAVYPGFTLQPIAWCHSHVFLMLGLFLFSLGAMLWAHRRPRLFWPLTLAAVPSAAMTMIVSEYFVGLELLRPALLWLALDGRASSTIHRLTRTAIAWAPYLALLILYLFWRLILFHPRGVNDQSQILGAIAANPVSYGFYRLYVMVTDLVEAGLIAWAQTLSGDLFAFDSLRWVLMGLGLVMVGATVTYRYLTRIGSEGGGDNSTEDEQGSVRWARQAFALGMVAMLVGGLPVWLGNRDIRLDSLADRYTLQLMLGSAIVLVAVTHRIARGRDLQIAILSIVVGLSVGLHFRNSAQFRQDWHNQQSLFWQLSWRAPSLKPGTAVLIDESVVSFPRSYTLFGPVNFVYAPDHASRTLDYGLFALPTILGDELPALAHDTGFTYGFRTLSFKGSTSNSLVLWYAPPSCLRVLDPLRDELPHLPPLARSARGLSRVDLIRADAAVSATPPESIFGREPAHAWCYFFQKVDLARQMNDWVRIAQLGDEARRLGLTPGDSTEWVPIIEGYVHVGRYEDARALAARVLKDIPAIQSVQSVFDVNRVQRRPLAQMMPVASTELCRLLAMLAKSDRDRPAPTQSLSSLPTQATCVAS